MAPIERFNKTLRMYIARYKGVYESRRLSQAIINEIVTEYNSTDHSSILDYKPIEALTDSDAIDEIYFHNLELRKSDKDVPETSVKVGDHVRVLLKKDTDKFFKTGQLWSKEIYTVDDYDKTKHQYLLSNGNAYQHDQLQVIDKGKFDKFNHKFEETIVEETIDQHTKRVKPRNIAITRDVKDVLNQPVLDTKRARKPRKVTDV
jgi:hypothetical protein